jgi:dihydroorotate dehydrogenase
VRANRIYLGAASRIVRLVWGAARLRRVTLPSMPVSVMGLEFPNPIGLAAGFDKDAVLIGRLEPSGFGFVEIGTVKPLPEPGKSRGLEVVRANLERSLARRASKRQVLGISLGSNQPPWDERAGEDYLALMSALGPYADYLVINLSSPEDREGLNRANPTLLRGLLERVADRARELAETTGKPIPVAVKVAVTAMEPEVPNAVRCTAEAGLDGIIVETDPAQAQEAVCRRLRELADYLAPLALISVGGIASVDDAYRRMENGAALVQLFRGVLRKGPFLARRLVAGLRGR